MSLTLTTALAVLRDGAAATSGGGDGDRRRRAGTRGDGTSWKVTWVLVKLSAGRGNAARTTSAGEGGVEGSDLDVRVGDLDVAAVGLNVRGRAG